MSALAGEAARARGYGSLVLWGEYAVLEPGGMGLVAAVDASIEASVRRSPCWRLETPFGSGEIEETALVGEEGLEAYAGSSMRFVVSALSEYVVERRRSGSEVEPLYVSVQGFERQGRGKKLPLGVSGLSSSAAAVAALVAGVSAFCRGEGGASERIGFPMALRAHRRAQGGVGSGIDIAAAFFGGFQLFSADAHRPSVTDHVWPKGLRMRAVWTGYSAATAPRIEIVDVYRQRYPEKWKRFVEDSRILTEALSAALRTEDFPGVFQGIEAHRTLLLRLGDAAGFEIETPEIQRLVHVGRRFGAAKASGAGGGDCGILFFDEKTPLKDIDAALEAEGLFPFPLDFGVGGGRVARR